MTDLSKFEGAFQDALNAPVPEKSASSKRTDYDEIPANKDLPIKITGATISVSQFEDSAPQIRLELYYPGLNITKDVYYSVSKPAILVSVLRSLGYVPAKLDDLQLALDKISGGEYTAKRVINGKYSNFYFNRDKNAPKAETVGTPKKFVATDDDIPF